MDQIDNIIERFKEETAITMRGTYTHVLRKIYENISLNDVRANYAKDDVIFTYKQNGRIAVVSRQSRRISQ